MFRLDLIIGILCGILLRSVLFEGFFYFLRRLFREDQSDPHNILIREILNVSPTILQTEQSDQSLIIDILGDPIDLFTWKFLSNEYPLALRRWIQAIQEKNKSIDPDHLLTRSFRLYELHRIFYDDFDQLILIRGVDIKLLLIYIGNHCPIQQFRMILFGISNFL